MLGLSRSMGNRARSTRWKRFQKTAEMTFWGDKPNGSSLPPEGGKEGKIKKEKIHRAGIISLLEGEGRDEGRGG